MICSMRMESMSAVQVVLMSLQSSMMAMPCTPWGRMILQKADLVSKQSHKLSLFLCT